ncbi:hypothetical protein [Nannocystis sp. SCPEA4]|uniref:IS66 family insertion sequence element accessory protein TnpA n=1 Tax=Nannocystis sp. SCPEA4 TaxID=2996787 RepID=UPI002271620E|nr:hypothetical protein [Nannocystis sp. SCPEA4]MCY1061743.1 hypothetical protein [Nannocystis sp. SCPEA4]
MVGEGGEGRDWEERVEGWGRSGMTCKEYAAKIGVNPHTLAGWRWKLRKRTAATSSTARWCGSAARSTARCSRIELFWCDALPPPVADPLCTPPDSVALDFRLSSVLVDEFSASWECTITVVTPTDGGAALTLACPAPELSALTVGTWMNVTTLQR